VRSGGDAVPETGTDDTLNTLLRDGRMRTLWLRVGLVLILGVSAAACVPKDYLLTTQDPVRVPAKSDPVYLLTPADSRDVDAQLQPVLKRQMMAAGYNVVLDANLASWILGVSSRAQAFGTVRPPNKLNRHYDDTNAIHIYLFPAPQYRSGLRDPAWQGVAVAENASVGEYGAAMLKDLLGAYGGDYENEHLMVFDAKSR